MSMSRMYSVCGKCFLENPEDYNLAKEPICHRHPNTRKMEVFWDRAKGLFFHKTRPVPDKQIRGRFVLCTFEYQCKGERCTYAHSLAEQEEWNRLKTSGKLELCVYYAV